MTWETVGPVVELGHKWVLASENAAFAFDEQRLVESLVQYRSPVGIFDVNRDVFELVARIDGGELVGPWWVFLHSGIYVYKGLIPLERRTSFRRLTESDVWQKYPVRFLLPDGGTVTFYEDKRILVAMT